MTRSRSAATAAAVAVLAATVLVAPVVAPAPARADDNYLVITGPSDLADSGLIDALASAYQDFYTGAVIEVRYRAADDAEAVAAAADRSSGVGVLLVDDPELESAFVADGHSAEGYGRSAFWSDVVLLGPSVVGGSPLDLVDSLEQVAARGAAGQAQFLSRGGTSDDTVREHALWALTEGVPTCTVSAADGGGESPSTVAGPCPDPVPLPSWYSVTRADQPATIEAADRCQGHASTTCFVLGGHGTARRHEGSLDRLRIVARDEQPAHLDVTSDRYRAYAVAGVQDVTGLALEFVAWLTTPAAQDLVGGYLSRVDDDPYHRAAAIEVPTVYPVSSRIVVGQTAQICGRLRHPAPGRSPVPPTTVTIGYYDRRSSPVRAVTVGRTRSTSTGFCLRFRPGRNHSYFVTVPGVTTVLDADLGLRETLQPRTYGVDQVDVGAIYVASRLDDVAIRRGRTSFHIGARLVPVPASGAYVDIHAGREGTAPTRRVRVPLRPGTRQLDRTVKLGPGRWRITVRYRAGTAGLAIGTYDKTILLH